ncbi:amino acid/amide ABC transporter ATP-binding protein 1, HAAT family [Tistlia consotensis]|uniref:Amino acid/amide ABC transporter ATP-binding protein 1, HAAT family n=1 Tax=Tistlia consotensis USBA 355 TaxID=560819 RepID=A0A1Y6CSI6_9PROT|nr:ABC transporter ATP-binding protein [Tistlia consotensis]SMF76172.1 amino acid/amide ABC transporter ATP-binding protein 1, HAAT family [Tistlia consotensis USBA 355]SNS12379.1 amino acid/amide ABC transporter ATP-binding protein 1, HAAT family [Tistlia consotensis]
MSASPPALELVGVAKSFGAIPVVRGVDLQIPAGERHAVIGPNGAGKSTLFNLVSGLFPLSGGDIRLRGRSIAGLPPHRINRSGLARSFQITNIFHRLSVFENLRIGVMARHGLRFGLFRPVARMRQVNEEARAILALVRLEARAEDLAGDLTYSEQRALEIGMTLTTGADVILLDEPTAGMSREETDRAVELIREVTAGKTLLMVEHDMSVVFSLCDRVSVLVYGEILATDTPERISANRAVQEAYLGEEPDESSGRDFGQDSGGEAAP